MTLGPTLAKFKICHKGYGHFLKKIRCPAQNLGSIGNWAPVSLFPCSARHFLQNFRYSAQNLGAVGNLAPVNLFPYPAIILFFQLDLEQVKTEENDRGEASSQKSSTDGEITAETTQRERGNISCLL